MDFLVFLSLLSLIATFYIPIEIISFLIFFFGIWGGVELGRYLDVNHVTGWFVFPNIHIPN